jgi:hypothetical protein
MADGALRCTWARYAALAPRTLRVPPPPPRAGRRAAAAMASAAAQSTAPVAPASLVPGFLAWIECCNDGAAALAAGELWPFEVDGAAVGHVTPAFAARLAAFPAAFAVTEGRVALSAPLRGATPEQRTAAVGAATAALAAEGAIAGWRGELFPVTQRFGAPPALLIERAAAVYFGTKGYGVHINGFVVLPNGEIELWVARRAADKPTWPGRRDHLVAGGQPAGLSLAANVAKECAEEAGVPAALAARARAAGAVSYTSLQAAGLKRDVLFCL